MALKLPFMVVSATSSPNTTITYGDLTECGDCRGKIFIDLAVPRDIDPACAARMRCFDTDSLGAVGPGNREELAAMEAIAGKYLRQLQERTAATGIQLLLPAELTSFLMEKCPGKDGARQLRRLVQTEVEGALSSFLLGCSRRPTRVRVKMEGKEICFLS